MSSDLVARWNSIPMVRSEPVQEDGQNRLKRSRSPGPSDDEDDEDDNVSLVSRTPSPNPDGMDMDASISKYDEYVAGGVREVITVETKIKATNKGFAMLSKLGWTEGQPLGLSSDGRVEPVPFTIKRDLTGLGKINQDVRMIETTVSQRRGLDSERQTKETEEQRIARESSVARRAAVQSEINETLRAFYCDLCEKQFKTVAQYDEHTNSYAHHHKARFRDMQASQRVKAQGEIDKRKEKERKREEKELRKIAAAAGIRMKPVAQAAPASAEPDAAPTPSGSEPPKTDSEVKSTGFKKGGWASIPSAESASNSSRAGSQRTRWASVGSPAAPPPPPNDAPPPPPSSQSAENAHTAVRSSAPAFRNAGWTSLDTGSSHMPPTSAHPPAPSYAGSPNCLPPPPPPPDFATHSQPPRKGFSPLTAPFDPPPPGPPPPGPPPPGPSAMADAPVRVPPPSQAVLTPSPARTPAVPGKSNWQQFQAKGPKRR